MPAQSVSCEDPFLGCRLLTFCILTRQRAETGGRLSCDSQKGTNPIHEGYIPMTSSNPNSIPMAPPPNTIMFGERVSRYEFWGHANIQSTTASEFKIFIQIASCLHRGRGCLDFCPTTMSHYISYHMKVDRLFQGTYLGWRAGCREEQLEKRQIMIWSPGSDITSGARVDASRLQRKEHI